MITALRRLSAGIAPLARNWSKSARLKPPKPRLPICKKRRRDMPVPKPGPLAPQIVSIKYPPVQGGKSGRRASAGARRRSLRPVRPLLGFALVAIDVQRAVLVKQDVVSVFQPAV